MLEIVGTTEEATALDQLILFVILTSECKFSTLLKLLFEYDSWSQVSSWSTTPLLPKDITSLLDIYPKLS